MELLVDSPSIGRGFFILYHDIVCFSTLCHDSGLYRNRFWPGPGAGVSRQGFLLTPFLLTGNFPTTPQ